MDNLNKKKSVTSRRNFLRKAWIGLGVLAGVELGAVSFGFLMTGKKNSRNNNTTRLLDVGSVSDFDNNTVYPFRNGRFYLVRLKDGGLLALSMKCTHLGCSVMWDESKSKFMCPCHSSSFDLYGNVIDPPAPRALDMYPLSVKEGILKVDTGNPKRRINYDKNQVFYV